MSESKAKYEMAIKRIREILMCDDVRDGKYRAICEAMSPFMPPVTQPTIQGESESNAQH